MAKLSSLSRALMLAGLMAAAGTASAFMGDESAELSAAPHTETWMFPDGSSYTVNRSDGFGMPDTTALGAGSESLLDESSFSNTETWMFPDGSSHTVNRSGFSAPDTTSLGAGSAFIDEDSAVASNTETWMFPDGSSHTVTRSDDSRTPVTLQTAEYRSTSGSELWVYPDGTSPDGTSRNLAAATTTDFDMESELTSMGAGAAPEPVLQFGTPMGFEPSLGAARQEPIYTVSE